MFTQNASPSLADIAAVTDGNRNNNGFGDGMGGWWVLIILLALFGGFNNNGNWGNNGSRNQSDIVIVPYGGGIGGMGYGYGFENAALQRGFDNQTVISKLDGLGDGLCSLGYDQLAQMNSLGNTVQQTGWNLSNAIRDGQVASMQQFNALTTQIGNCCCEQRQGLADLKYTMAADTCAIKGEIKDSTRDIIDNANANARMLNDTVRQGFTDLAMQQKDQYIAELERKLNNCDRDSALMAMGQYVVNQVRPTPQPSYNVPNPFCCNTNNNNNCCGNNLGCCA